MASPQQTVPPPHTSKLRNFWHRVSEGLEINELWSQFEKDARSSYRLYSADLEQQKQSSTMQKRGTWQTIKVLFWAILEKLTPARRVLVLLGLVLLIFPSGGYSYEGRDGHVEVHELDLHVWGGC